MFVSCSAVVFNFSVVVLRERQVESQKKICKRNRNMMLVKMRFIWGDVIVRLDYTAENVTVVLTSCELIRQTGGN